MKSSKIGSIILIILFISVFNFIFYGCSSKTNTTTNTLRNSDIIQKYFDLKEIYELGKIVDYFDKIVLKDCKKTKVDSCYNKYFSIVKKNLNDKGDLKIDTFGLSRFLHSIPKDVFNKIWYYANGKARTNQIFPAEYQEAIFMDINTKSKYFDFLRDYSKTNDDLNEYYKSINMLKCISPTANAKFITQFRKFDFNIPEIRLIYAVHFIAQANYVHFVY